MTNTHKYSVGLFGAISLIIGSIVSLEGGYVDNPVDPGGKTIYGVTERTAREYGYTNPIEQLTKDEAATIYAEMYVHKPGFDKVILLSTAVGEEITDSGVNVGPKRPTEWFQTALNSLNRDGKDYAGVDVDGVLGPATLSAYKSLQAIRGKTEACELMLKLLDAQQAVYYMNLVKLRTFTVGWVSNRIGNVPLDRCKNDTIREVQK